ncbi:type II toxin-antitoxin system VapC family toxin [Thiobacillus denitrificans]|uniref:Twitching motility protein PilT n=1 Tax=Thiobacillus denitrificans TaxID=36861 RepID=A0A106BQQ3_THIDE|nr:type II toxin-antitoxin system VapC family toxin [Thiobacillus denitrificans]KVW96891.1 twitching motility protein PilT [Thiobacillus denitrificans]
MRILLDTHVLLWAVAQSSRLPQDARGLLEDPDNALFCSTASLWEIAIKAGLRRQDFVVDIPALRAAMVEMDIAELPVLGSHAEQVLKLPAIHKDPFDRMLVAQSMIEPLVLLTNDAAFVGYWDGVRLV